VRAVFAIVLLSTASARAEERRWLSWMPGVGLGAAVTNVDGANFFVQASFDLKFGDIHLGLVPKSVDKTSTLVYQYRGGCYGGSSSVDHYSPFTIRFGADLGTPHFVLSRRPRGPITLAARFGLSLDTVIDDPVHDVSPCDQFIGDSYEKKNRLYLLNNDGLVATFGVSGSFSIFLRADFTVSYLLPGSPIGSDEQRCCAYGGLFWVGVYLREPLFFFRR
jgi:hypothetical protein